MKAIQTTFHGPTNTRGSRITATAGSNRVTLSYDYESDADGNHDAAALALCEKMGWTGYHLMRGTLESAAHKRVGNVYTFDDHGNRLRIPEAMREASYIRAVEESRRRAAEREASEVR